jgi:hypothetical protein
VPALCNGPYRGRALTTVVSFTYGDATVETVADYAAGNYRDELKAYPDPRLLFAAVQWLHEHEPPANPAAAYALLVDQIVQKGANQFRFRGAPVKRREDFERELEQQEARDRDAGRDLRQILLTSSAPAYPRPEDAQPDLRTP